MKLFLSLLFVILVQVSWTQDSISVLFIGNSYLSVNNLPAMVGDLSNSLGDHMLIDSKMNGGYTFQSHSNDAVTYTKKDFLSTLKNIATPEKTRQSKAKYYAIALNS